MTEEFDKEIDTLLRQAAQSVDTVSDAQSLHLDADEINAFAENALPAKARLRTMEHLADCSRCRKILSDVIAFYSEKEPEVVPLIKTKTVTAAPWYKQLFVFPKMAYMMGALALLFTGIIAVIVLQNSSEKNDSQIAQIEEKSFNDSSLPSSSLNSAENANSASNTAMSSNTSSGLVYPSNSNASASPTLVPRNKELVTSAAPAADAPTDRAADDKTANSEPKTEISANEESAKKEKVAAPSVAAAPPSPKRENSYTVDGTLDSVVSKPQTELPTQNSVVQNQAANQTAIMPDSRNARSTQNLPLNGRNVQQMKNRAEVAAGSVKSDKDEERKDETRAAGGKNFRRADGVWYDTKYNGQKTTNVSRGSSEYKKLDSGLRSIADNLGGVVVIIWKNKAYRIQ